MVRQSDQPGGLGACGCGVFGGGQVVGVAGGVRSTPTSGSTPSTPHPPSNTFTHRLSEASPPTSTRQHTHQVVKRPARGCGRRSTE
ncbi:hypothetical protein E1267_11905 [Nonomuraea longispora]|uniref:Uncharacterized protein n=1 Tax=Nonomuraea longispora TaxID=1848320 RepID=A0A4R4NJR4_9ACTN|nr:hypothetical protein E1267_11905 [Nonomuraea longispora]